MDKSPSVSDTFNQSMLAEKAQDNVVQHFPKPNTKTRQMTKTSSLSGLDLSKRAQFSRN
jgi:hypothetical protein